MGAPESCSALCTRSSDLVTVTGRYDEHSHEQFVPGDPSKRAFTYFVLTGGRFIYASALRLAVLKFILSMTVRSLLDDHNLAQCLCIIVKGRLDQKEHTSLGKKVLPLDGSYLDNCLACNDKM